MFLDIYQCSISEYILIFIIMKKVFFASLVLLTFIIISVNVVISSSKNLTDFNLSIIENTAIAQSEGDYPIYVVDSTTYTSPGGCVCVNGRWQELTYYITIVNCWAGGSECCYQHESSGTYYSGDFGPC